MSTSATGAPPGAGLDHARRGALVLGATLVAGGVVVGLWHSWRTVGGPPPLDLPVHTYGAHFEDLLASGDYDRLLDQSRLAVSIDTRPDLSHHYAGLAHARRGEFEEARKSFREVVRARPDSIEGWINLGVALANLGRVDEAERHLRQALELDEESVDAHFTLAAILEARGEPRAARRELETTLRLAPDHAPAQQRLRALGPSTGR